jgi:phosphoribosyl-AMP cyclohydrolase
MPLNFAAPSPDKVVQEREGPFAPLFGSDGLVTAVVTDVADGELLMVAHMNPEALALTIETGVAHYYSRSRQKIWKKGETSGNLQTVSEMRTDCDQDAIWLKVSVAGHEATCHTGRRSCFYRVVGNQDGAATLKIVDEARRFDPAEVYGSAGTES